MITNKNGKNMLMESQQGVYNHIQLKNIVQIRDVYDAKDAKIWVMQHSNPLKTDQTVTPNPRSK